MLGKSVVSLQQMAMEKYRQNGCTHPQQLLQGRPPAPHIPHQDGTTCRVDGHVSGNHHSIAAVLGFVIESDTVDRVLCYTS